MRRLDETLPWYRALGPRERSWVGLVAQAGITSFVTWLGDRSSRLAIAGDVFGTAPRELTRAVTLAQTLELVRTVLGVVEDHVPELCNGATDPELVHRVREAVLVYGREVAFSAAGVYAEAAETRGAWDTRLEAWIVDTLLRDRQDPSLPSRIAALGWRPGPVVAVAGSPQLADSPDEGERMRVAALRHAGDVLVGHQDRRLLVVAADSGDPWKVARTLAPHFGAGPVVVGPPAPTLSEAGPAVRAAVAGLAAAPGWPGAPRPVHADDLLPERVLAGDQCARVLLVERICDPLSAAGPAFAETVVTYLERGRSLEATAKALFVHPNTVRYRLRRVADLVGWDVTRSRDAFVVQVALAVARLPL